MEGEFLQERERLGLLAAPEFVERNVGGEVRESLQFVIEEVVQITQSGSARVILLEDSEWVVVIRLLLLGRWLVDTQSMLHFLFPIREQLRQERLRALNCLKDGMLSSECEV